MASSENWIIKKSKDGQYYFIYKAQNGQTIVTSEMYTQKHNVVSAIATIVQSVQKCNTINVKDETDE